MDSARDYLDDLSVFAAGLNFSALPDEVRVHTAWVLADTLAAIVAGSAEPEVRALATALVSSEQGDATLPGLARRASADQAALINGTAGTFLEMDEGNRFSRGHPCIHVLPAVMALAEKDRPDTEGFLSGLVVGYELGSRLGAASRVRGGFHPHGTWGTVGAAAACARLLDQSPQTMRETINIASSLTTASSKRTMLEGGLVRNVYAGMSNRNGLLAVNLAQCGFSGERDGPGTLLGVLISDHFDRDAATAGLGSDWHILQNYFKLHSCCRYNHGALDALDAIAVREGLPDPSSIERIEVESYHLAAELNDSAPRNTLAAKFSVPFAVATRIIRGSSALSSFTWDAVRDPATLALAKRVSVIEDPAMTARLPAERPARVTLFTREGGKRVGEVGINRGDDASPYTPDELRQKFLDLTSRVWPLSHGKAVLGATFDLCSGRSTFTDWVELLRRPPVV
ncbi:MAG: MmgE/PrpD family protein [Betaproteobacteria bacterium]